ncbi:MAG: DUF2723 domain-containing protein [Bacteroidota bacterium]
MTETNPAARIFTRFAPWLAFLISLSVYLSTLAPGLMPIDSGELAAVQYTLGLAHATGYPVFIIAGRFFQCLPLGLEPAFQANLMAAILCAAAAGVMVRTLQLVLLWAAEQKANRNALLKPALQAKTQAAQQASPPKATVQQSKSRKAVPANAPVITEVDANSTASANTEHTTEQGKPGLTLNFRVATAAFAAGLTLAFSRTFWLQSTSTEVYSLHVLMVSLIVLTLLRAYIKNSLSNWLVFALVLALSFGNHMSTVFMIPGIGFLYFARKGFKADTWKTLGLMLILFFTVLAAEYYFLVILANTNPIVNWGNPNTWERFWYHVLGKQFSVWTFSGGAVAKRQLALFFKMLAPEFAYIGLAGALAGFAALYNYSVRLFLFSLITALSCIFFAVNYDIHDIDSYFLTAFIMLCFGIAWIFLVAARKLPLALSAGLMLLVPAAEAYSNYGKADQSNMHVIDDYTLMVMNNTLKNGIIISKQWDYLISPSLYHQFVKKHRPDIIFIDKELMRRSWYFTELENQHPGIFKGAQPEIQHFLELLVPFEKGGQFDGAALTVAFRVMMSKIIESNYKTHPIYIAPEIALQEMETKEMELPFGWKYEPACNMLRVVNEDKMHYRACDCPDIPIRFAPYKVNDYSDRIKEMLLMTYSWRAEFELRSGHREKAIDLALKITKADPGAQLTKELEGILNLHEQGVPGY